MFDKIKGLLGYSIDQFAGDIVNVYYQMGFDGQFTWDKASSRLTFDNGHTFYLKNMYEENKHLSKAQMRNFIGMLLRENEPRDTALDWETIKSNIYPRVRTRSELSIRSLYIRSLNRHDELPSVELAPLGADLFIELVLDSDVNITTVAQAQLDTWGITAEKARARALENFHAVSAAAFEEVAPGVYQSTWGDNYDASRLVFPDLMRAYPINGDPVLAIPTRDVLLFTGSADEAGLSALIQLVKGYFSAQRYISFRPYVYTAGRYDFFYPPAAHSLHPAFAQLHLSAIKGDYDEQKDLLEEVLVQDNQDVFVATYSVLQAEGTGEFYSWAAWSENVPTYLPVTDLVALVVERGDDMESLGFVTWDDLIKHCESLLQPTEHYPKRVLVETFPDAAMRAQLTFVTP